MNARVIPLAFLMFGLAIALGGTGETSADVLPITENAAASCTELDLGDVTTGCLESAACKVVNKFPCIE